MKKSTTLFSVSYSFLLYYYKELLLIAFGRLWIIWHAISKVHHPLDLLSLEILSL